MLSQAQRPSLPPSIDRLYPFSTRQLQLGEQRMSLAEAGQADAPPLIVLHGGLTWSFLFREVMQACAANFHVIAPDHVGFGLSSKPAEAGYHTLEQHISNLCALVQAMELERISLVLHEWGGPIGLGFATRFPQKVERIILVNTPAGPAYNDVKLPWQMRMLRSSAGSIAPGALLTFALRSLAAKQIAPDVLAAYKYPLKQQNGWIGPQSFARLLPETGENQNVRTIREITANLKSVSARVEIVWGKRDPIFRSPLLAYMLRDAFPNAAEPMWLESAGHLVPEDAPMELSDVLLAPFRPKPQVPKPLFNILK